MTELKNAESPEIHYDFDIHDPEAVDGVYDTYAEMRGKCPVAHSPKYGGHFVATSYEDIQEVLRNPGIYSSRTINVPDSIGQDGEMIPIQIDQPDHTTYRGIINPLFPPKRRRAHEPQTPDIPTELTDHTSTETKAE